MPSVVILGASQDPSKFGNKAVRAFKMKGYDVYPVNPKATQIEGLKTYATISEVPIDEIDMVSIYLPPQVTLSILNDLANKKIKEIWLNPGAESPAVVDAAEKLGLTIIEACSIVRIGMNPGNL